MKTHTAVQEQMHKALKTAFHYGQVYWEQADSESYSANKKAGETHAKFLKLCDETLQTLADVEGAPLWFCQSHHVAPLLPR